MHAVPKNIRRLRARDGISQETLADKLSVTRQAVSSWETGKTQPDIDTLIAIAAAFGVDVTEVIYGERPTAVPPQNRKKHTHAAVIFGAVTLVFILLEIFLIPYLRYLAGTYYIGYPIFLYTYLLRPAFYVCIPLALFNVLSLSVDLRLKKKAVRKAALLISVLFLVLYAVNAANTFLGLFPNFLVFVLVIPFGENAALFLLPGTALFFGLNK